ncbi:MAG: ferritin family protein [Gammaproteobacteria bacterium]|jgi:hypothetical protein|nr:ferritin family protein [Gammaproteobacteria bacterium]
MSPLQAFEVALSAEQKAYDFYNQVLTHVTDPEIHALFTELRDEEAEHERMLQEIITTPCPRRAQTSKGRKIRTSTRRCSPNAHRVEFVSLRARQYNIRPYQSIRARK